MFSYTWRKIDVPHLRARWPQVPSSAEVEARMGGYTPWDEDEQFGQRPVDG